MKRMMAVLTLVVVTFLLYAGCDILSDDGNAICNTDPADCPPVTPPRPSCGTFIPDLFPPTDIWACNLPASTSDAPTTMVTSPAPPPCGLLFCELTTTPEQGVNLDAETWFQSRGFLLPADGQTQIQCKDTKVTTWSGAYSLGPIFGLDLSQCVQTKTAPCAMFGDVCSSGMSKVNNPRCCQPPESTFAMVCNEGVSMQGGVCCVQTGDACQPGLPNGGCCPANADGVLDLCGDGTNSDANHVGLCCGANGASCQDPADDPQSDDFCCSGLCLPTPGGDYQCNDY